jgi:hypothetical protein
MKHLLGYLHAVNYGFITGSYPTYPLTTPSPLAEDKLTILPCHQDLTYAEEASRIVVVVSYYTLFITFLQISRAHLRKIANNASYQ